MTDIIIRPGAIYSMYWNPSICPILLPINVPNIMKYRVIVMAGGIIVWTQILRTLVVSFLVNASIPII
jgi:hypothetical protein